MLYHGLAEVWAARRLRRDPAGLSGAEVASDPQNRSRRCAWSSAPRTHGLLQSSPCEVPASACHPVAPHRAQEAGRPRVTLENQIRGFTVVFGIRLPRALSSSFIQQALRASE